MEVSEKIMSPAEIAFTKQSAIFDSLEKENKIVQWLRNRVHNYCRQLYNANESLLELNCGTGIDALFFASLGMDVLATDVSAGMLDRLDEKIKSAHPAGKIKTFQCSYLELNKIKNKKFNHVFSNFGGLNCTDKLGSVIQQTDNLLLPGGTVTFVIMPPVCPWEIMYALKGNFRTAFRRFKKQGAISHIEGLYFKTFYYSANEVKKMFGKSYSLISLKGLASVAPPPYMENFSNKYTSIFNFLVKTDEKFQSLFPFNKWADHLIITMQKNSPA